MTKYMKKITIIISFFFAFTLNSYADTAYFVDFKKVLNTSTAGANAQKKLQTKFQSESEKFKKLEKNIRDEETEIISQKQAISAEEYQKKVKVLRKKVADLQKNKQASLNKIAKSRLDARKKLLKAVNPIIKKYMEENKIRLILNKQSIILGDTSLEITDKIIAILNKKLPSLKLN